MAENKFLIDQKNNNDQQMAFLNVFGLHQKNVFFQV